MTDRDLYALLGVGRDLGVEDLRYAYEQAMRVATRSGDHRRALALSTAFDALPAGTKGSVYRNTHGSGAPFAPALVSPERPPRRARAPRNRAPRNRAPGDPGLPSPRPPAGRGRARLRIALYAVLIAAVVAGLAYLRFRPLPQHGSSGGQPAPASTLVVQESVPNDAATAADYGTAVDVPMDAPTGANGLVSLVCQSPTGGGSSMITAPRGALVACPNGGTPRVLG